VYGCQFFKQRTKITKYIVIPHNCVGLYREDEPFFRNFFRKFFRTSEDSSECVGSYCRAVAPCVSLHLSSSTDGGGHEPGREPAAAADDVFFKIIYIMNEIRIFNHPTFGAIRTAGTAENPLFCLKDVCRILGIGNPSDLKRRLDEKGVQLIDYQALDLNEGTVQGNTMANFIDEPNLYRSIFKSRKSVARMFQKWVFGEVLPAIRRHGAYATGETLERIAYDPDYGAALLHTLKKEREARKRLEGARQSLKKELDEVKPMADYCRMVLDSPQTVTVTQIAQDYGYSARAFNELLRDMGIQFRQNEQWILYAGLKAQGYVMSSTAVYTRYDGSQGTKMHTRWTQQGRLYLYDKLKKAGILPVMEELAQDLS
jgi:anti-repressor protein